MTTAGKVARVGGQIAANTGRVLQMNPKTAAAGRVLTAGGVAFRRGGKQSITAGRAAKAAGKGKGRVARARGGKAAAGTVRMLTR